MTTDLMEPARCVLCGGPEPFDAGLCPGCGGAAPAAGDTLVFVRTAETGADSRFVAEALDGLCAGRAHLSERAWVAAGHRALLRVPSTAADTVVHHLAERGIPAEGRPANRAWASIPVSYYFVVGGVALVGYMAGASALPELRWLSPAYALLLLLAAQVRLKVPAIQLTRPRARFPLKVERALAETFGRLPDDHARDLLTRLVRAAEPLHRVRRAAPRGGPGRPGDIADLLLTACRAAEDLSDLERCVVALGNGPAAERAVGLYEALITRFHDGIEVLHRLRAEAAAAGDEPTHQQLARVVAALDENADAYAAARKELAALLRVS